MGYMTTRNVPAKVHTDYRVTIPADVRRELDLEKGEYVLIDVKPLDGGITE